jgi:UDP-glucuronate 4-epimerase
MPISRATSSVSIYSRELAGDSSVEHLVYASSSSVYGSNKKSAFAGNRFRGSSGVAMYAATKKIQRADGAYLQPSLHDSGNGLEILHGLWTAGQTGHGLFRLHGTSISRVVADTIFNNGDFRARFVPRLYLHRRYRGGDCQAAAKPPVAADRAPSKVYNLGNNSPEKLMTLHFDAGRGFEREALERAVVFEKVFEPLKPVMYRRLTPRQICLQEAVGFKPQTSIKEGLRRFAQWYVEYYGVKNKILRGDTGDVPFLSTF